MKSLSWTVLGLLVAVPSFAADNNIKMVTYFPVPYAAYGDLGVTGTCDVGLMGQCALDAGKSLTVAKATSDSRALNTGSIIVRKGTLGLNPASSLAIGTSITAGSGIGSGVLEFSHDLAVTNINSSRISKGRAMNEAQLDSLNMYGHAFPVCDATNHEISWKNLTIGKKSGVFLVCGAGEEAPRTPCANSCPSGYMRNPEVDYQEDGECCIKQPTVYYFRCTSRFKTMSEPGNKYASFDAALRACESGEDPFAVYYSTKVIAPQRYQKCGTSENEEYVQSKTAYSYQTLQSLTTPTDPGQIQPAGDYYVVYSCVTSCARPHSGGFDPYSCVVAYAD